LDRELQSFAREQYLGAKVMYRVMLAAAAALLLAQSAALAQTIDWGGPGWYARETSENVLGLVAGPFGSKEACLAYLHAHYSGDDLDDTDCVHFISKQKADQAVNPDGSAGLNFPK
jgi:hypothetical protein